MDEGRGQVEAPPHTAGVGPHDPIGGVCELEALQELVGAGCDPSAWQLGEAADQAQILAAREVTVDGRVLAREPDAVADTGGVPGDVVAEDPSSPSVWADDGGQHPHGGGLAGPVRS
jgi:hypothetical protein